MKLFKVCRSEPCNYDEYSDFVVVAKDEEEAKIYGPEGELVDWEDEWSRWASSHDKVTAECIGTAAKGLKRGEVICSSFHAG